MGLASEYRSRNRGSSVGVGALVALGIATVCVGGVMLGLWISDRHATGSARTGPSWQIVLPDQMRSRKSLVREATQRALTKRNITAIHEDAQVQAFDETTYVVSGKCMHRDLPGVYVSTCKLVNGTWQVVNLQLPVDQIDQSFRGLDKLLQDALQDATQ